MLWKNEMHLKAKTSDIDKTKFLLAAILVSSSQSFEYRGDKKNNVVTSEDNVEWFEFLKSIVLVVTHVIR